MNPFFNYYENLWNKKKPFTTEDMPVNAHVYIRMASFQLDALFVMNTLNKYRAIPTDCMMKTLYYALPKRQPRPKKLPKKTADTLTTKKRNQLDRIMKRFNVNEVHGLQLLELLEIQKINIGE